jgi:8-oxo-dGTP diphosphatase
MKPASLKTQVSSGGVIFRKHKGRIEVALIAVKGGTVWCLPKGIVNKGETPEETALREVEEETGLKGNILGKIGQISYWYFIKEENVKCKKTVYFYLMQYVSGSTDNHDWEVDESAWFPIDEAINKIAFKGDREIVEKAKRMILDNG